MSQPVAKVVTTLGISVGVHTLFMNYQSTLELSTKHSLHVHQSGIYLIRITMGLLFLALCYVPITITIVI